MGEEGGARVIDGTVPGGEDREHAAVAGRRPGNPRQVGVGEPLADAGGEAVEERLAVAVRASAGDLLVVDPVGLAAG